MMKSELVFLSWELPWPAQSGGDLRTLGLIKELSKSYSLRLVALVSRPMTEKQGIELERYVKSITCVPMVQDRLRIYSHMLIHQMPYHCAVIDLSFHRVIDVLQQIQTYPGVVYASYGHWGTLIPTNSAPNWILDQHNADVHFWRVYASQASRIGSKVSAIANWWLARTFFPSIYSSVGYVVSVCNEDRQLTLELAPCARVAVIENGIDCSYFAPNRDKQAYQCLLFTGTSAPRNVTALRGFVRNIYPLIQAQIPNVALLVAGNFSVGAQAEFSEVPHIHFTGRVEDMRPFFERCDVFVAPFEETHGSKLKIAEAMSMSMPIVSTPAGVRGFPLVHGESVLLAANAQEFATQTIDLLRNPARRQSMGQEARRVALSTVDWSILGDRLARIVQGVMHELNLENI